MKDLQWFEHRLVLLEAVTAASLAAQTDQDFHWAVFVDPDLDPGIRARLQAVVSKVPGGWIVDHVLHRAADVAQYADELGLARDGRILTGRLDDDDAIERHTVEKLHRLVDDWLREAPVEKSLAVTFRHGFEWIMYDMVDVLKEQKWNVSAPRRQGLYRYDYPFHSLSVFALGPVKEKVTSITFGHATFAEYAEQRQMDVIIDDTPDMWLYARHKQTDSSILKAKGDFLPVDYDDLERRFGVVADQVRAYVERADDVPYVVEKKAMGRRHMALGEVRKLENALRARGLSPEERADLEAQIAAARAQYEKLGELVGEHELRTRPEPPRPSAAEAALLRAGSALLCWTSAHTDGDFRAGVKIGDARTPGEWSEGWEHTTLLYDRDSPLAETVAGRLLRLSMTLTAQDGVDPADLFRELSQVREFHAVLHPAPRES